MNDHVFISLECSDTSVAIC